MQYHEYEDAEAKENVRLMNHQHANPTYQNSAKAIPSHARTNPTYDSTPSGLNSTSNPTYDSSAANPAFHTANPTYDSSAAAVGTANPAFHTANPTYDSSAAAVGTANPAFHTANPTYVSKPSHGASVPMGNPTYDSFFPKVNPTYGHGAQSFPEPAAEASTYETPVDAAWMGKAHTLAATAPGTECYETPQDAMKTL